MAELPSQLLENANIATPPVNGAGSGCFQPHILVLIHNQGFGVGTICMSPYPNALCGKLLGRLDSRSQPIRTFYGIPLLRTYWKQAMTFARFKSYLDIATSAPR